MNDNPREARAAARGNWQAHVYRLGEEPPGDDLSAVTTPEQRLAMVWELTAWMWELSGQPLPSYSRAEMPIHVSRRP